MENNIVKTILQADLRFTYPVNMSEFNQRVLKVDDVNNARKEYLREKSPAEEKVIEIFDNLEKELSELGYTCVKNLTYSYEENPSSMLKNLLKDTLLASDIPTPPPIQKIITIPKQAVL